MTKLVTVLTPQRRRSDAVDLGNRLWRTQLLPLGEIDYKGRKLKFTKEYLEGLITAFKQSAFNQVPFQLADGENKHNNDPERTRGEIKDLELTPDGLDVIVEATESGDKVIRENPKLGVSARIYENFKRSDKKFWPAAIQHVLGTLDPHIAGMKPWQEVAALSNEGGGRVLDLTEATYEEEGSVPLSKQQLKELLQKVRDQGTDVSDEDLDELLEGVEDPGDELSDEELQAILAEAEGEGEGDPGKGSGDKQPIAAARTGGDALELASLRAQNEATIAELARVRSQLDEQAFENEKGVFVNAGISPALVELARPLLEGSGHVVDLANGDEIDAGAVMRRVLVELSGTIKMLDLGNLMGRPDEPTEEDEKQEKDLADFVENERKRLGL